MPWSTIQTVEVRQVMEIDVGDDVVRALAFGRTLRQQRSYARRTHDEAGGGAPTTIARQGVDYTDFVASRLADVAKSRGGGIGGSGGEGGRGQPVLRTWRRVDLAVLAGLAALTAVLALLAR